MAVDETALQVVQSLYDAALDEALWPDALNQLIKFTKSQAASVWVLDSSDQLRLPSFTCVNFDPAAIAEYLDHFAALDPTVQYLAAHPDQPIVHDGLVITEREKERHPYYDWHNRLIDTRFRMVGQMRPAAPLQAGIAVHRGPTAGRYETQDLERFTFLYGHLKRALAIGFQLGNLGAIQQCTAELLDRNPAAILLLDAKGRVVHANRAACNLQRGGDGIAFSPRGLAFARKHDKDKFTVLVGRALSRLATSAEGPGGVMRVQRASGKRPYVVLVAPVAGRYPALSFLRPAVCVTITDPDAQQPVPLQRLRATFELTQAEARLASLIAAGEDLRAAAEKLDITYGTARARLAVVFHKTGTRRQGELVRLLLTACAAG